MLVVFGLYLFYFFINIFTSLTSHGDKVTACFCCYCWSCIYFKTSEPVLTTFNRKVKVNLQSGSTLAAVKKKKQ